ncbi:NAD(P)H-dependent oxidoreductase [Flavobacterium supellecticarium]|uniref:NAD(P)H-dependent oxidoreductase n=1 Tax=Flavobacterium supellecticarium TaxID=2565924 RepID=A0A4S4A3Q3_9FLAO|nr:NAD(P)H-dependent oxidoreductase [Flavobacterium supellecticarium]THF53067.1 NAD(P)H-dependent oxidoreductase [Flavobacterium supellecticarium]
MKNILIINGHPNKDSFNFALADAYLRGVQTTDAKVSVVTIADLDFDPNLRFGYQKRMELEPDLQKAWELIQQADHLVWVHPVWWGGLPAITKGFLDRLFLPGMAFRYRKDSVWWDKLLNGKTARIITTLDQPGFYYWLVYGKPSVNQLKKAVLEFCGVKPVKVSYFGIIKTSNAEQRKKWLEKAFRLGQKLA